MLQPDESSSTSAAVLDAPHAQTVLPWVHVADRAPYFVTADGMPWTPIGHNDAIAWPPLMFALKRPEETEAYFAMLASHGATCIRLMLEYSHRNHHTIERPAGRFQARMIARWDRLFALAEQYAVRILLTPFDTFWMWKRWKHHPYNAVNGGPCRQRDSFLICPDVRNAIKRRLAFVIDRWGGSGALFAWDLWNEIHPAYAANDAGHFDEFISDVSTFVRERERARYGRAHPVMVSAFGPMLTDSFRSRELGHTAPDPRAADAIFRHRDLDVATVHTYAHGTIDDPKNTVAPALAMGRLTRESLAEIHDDRPFFDSEHGPIHTFKDKRRILPERFDDEYFRHLQWAHLASGGAGGGMRWPNRHPHVLTPGMHRAQRALAPYLRLIEWRQFRRRNLNEEIRVGPAGFAGFACGDSRQAVVWILRRKPLAADGTLARDGGPTRVAIRVPGLAEGTYRVTTFDTEKGAIELELEANSADGFLHVELGVERDIALAIRPRATGTDLASASA